MPEENLYSLQYY